MYKRHPSAYKRAPIPPQHPEREIQRKKVENENENGKSDQFSTPVKRASINYVYHTPTKSQALAHPPGWDKITWAPKVCRKAVRRMDFGEISTAAH